MIKEFIGKCKKLFTEKVSEKNIECAIDGETVDCSELEAPAFECGPGHFSHGYGSYVGVPAPVVLPNDEWFGSTPNLTEKQMTHEEMLEEAERREKENRKEETKEPENIHQVMYEMATKSGATTLQLNPIGGSENFQGGSENVHR